jgi:hypothetical protein
MPLRTRATGITFARAVLLAVIGSLCLLVEKADAQIGTTICGCQPAVYEITLDFSVTCDDITVAGPGINETACVLSQETGTDVTDFIPVLITDIQFLELNGDLQTLQQEPLTGAFRDGDVVRYTSVLAVQSEFEPNTLPRAFQMVLRGFNAIDEPIQITWVITYNNDCGIFPILFEGQQQGWSIFVSSRRIPIWRTPTSEKDMTAGTRLPHILTYIDVSCSTDRSRSTPELCVSLGCVSVAVKFSLHQLSHECSGHGKSDPVRPNGLPDLVPEYRSHRQSAFVHGRTRGSHVSPDPPFTPSYER